MQKSAEGTVPAMKLAAGREGLRIVLEDSRGESPNGPRRGDKWRGK